MDDEVMLDSCEQLIRLVDPKMDKPLYLCSLAEVEDERLRHEGFLARTGFNLDLQLRSHLEARGRWSGRGFASVFRMDLIPNGWRHLAGVALHEYAHFLDMLKDCEILYKQRQPVRPMSDAEREWTDVYNAVFDHLVRSGKAEENVPSWHGHGVDFVRACCHLAYRANRQFASIAPEHLLFVRKYHGCIGSENIAIECCRDELDSSLPIVEILRSDPPGQLVRYWNFLTGE